jgi:glycosyltransferase involved in cell wall biosynthesis
MHYRKGQAVEDISIITAVYNHEDTIGDTLNSILMQETSHRYHVYCLNDSSTDKSGDVIAEFQARYPGKISLFTSAENQGSGKNSFLHHRPPAKGRYWCLLAGDDFWTKPDKLEKQVNLLEENVQSVGCSSHTLLWDVKAREKSVIKPAKDNFNLMDMLVGRYPFYVHPSGILWRNIHFDTGFFLPPDFITNDISGDTALLHLMLAGGGEIINLPEVASCYRVTGRGVWSKMSQEEQNAANKMLLEVSLPALMPLKYRLAKRINQSRKLRMLRFLFPKPLNQ